MYERASTAAIILAGGSSSRMNAGRHKLLLPLGDRPVLAHVIDATLASQVASIIIVLGHQSAQVHSHISHYLVNPKITIIENPDYLQGMSTSLRTGLQVLTKKNQNTLSSALSSTESALVMLGDQPLITTYIIDTLIATWKETGKQIIAPLYKGKRGNPILFSACLFNELMEVTGDEGGRKVIERHRQELATVELSDDVASYDVDTWEAYQQVVAEWSRKQTQ